MKHKIVITRHRPWLRAGLIGAGAFALLIGAFGLYRYTRATTVSDFERARLEVEQLNDERRGLVRDLRAARTEIETLKDQLVYVQRSQDIDTQACTSVRGSLTGLQAEVSELREQLAFYRGIVSPEQSRAGVRVYEFKLQPGASASSYRYDLVLIQSVRHDRRVGGRAGLEFHGTRAGQKTSVKLDEVALNGPPNLVFSFKYFEEFAGEFRLPAGFTPTSVTVSLEPAVEGAPRIEDEFDWGKILLAGGGA